MNITFKPYESAKATLLANGNSIIRKKVRFEKPSKAFEWERRILDCAFFCKIAKSVFYNFDEIRKQYHVKYSSKLLYMETTYSTDLDVRNYFFIINTRYYFTGDGSDLIDSRADLHTIVEKRFYYLLNEMKYDLPSERYNSIVEHLKHIADATTY